MQLTLDQTVSHVIRAWEPGRLRIGERWLMGHVIVGAERIIENWAVSSPALLTVDDLAPALELGPSIVVIGTGEERLLPDVEIMAALGARGVGVEIMTTRAACRTFNVLLQEGRRVVAALFNA